MKKTILILALSCQLVVQAAASLEADKLKELIDKSRVEGSSYDEVKVLRDQLKATYPNTDFAAISESVYMSFLSEATSPTRSAEMKVIFEELEKRGEDKWYVVLARMTLISAYSQEGRDAEAKVLQPLRGINIVQRPRRLSLKIYSFSHEN